MGLVLLLMDLFERVVGEDHLVLLGPVIPRSYDFQALKAVIVRS